MMIQCFCCQQGFRFGPGRYDGRHVAAYDISVCDACYETNWDGWAPHMDSRLVAHMKAKQRTVPERNSKGWLPRDG